MSSRVEYLENVIVEQREVIEALQIKAGVVTEEDAFIENVEIKGAEDGGWIIECKKGLWGVYAPTIEQATSEAIHYFRQYYGDGEYDA